MTKSRNPCSGSGASVLESLWNRGALKPGSYPQLIRQLQRERNNLRADIKPAVGEMERLRAKVHEQITSLENAHRSH